MLAYTPLHHLVMSPGPQGVPVSDVLVMTSANFSDEPLCYRDEPNRLLALADLVLGHDRPIVTPCDDSVFRVVDGEPYPVRRSRGHAPLPVHLGQPGATVPRQSDGSSRLIGVEPSHWRATFAVGAELKNTVCVLEGADAVCSQHLGDMAGWESQQVLADTSAHVMDLYEVTPTRWACDAHPAYQTRAWAQRFAGVPLVEVQHHRAHAASLLAENHLLGTRCLVACFDGTGYGDDGAAWGGEWLDVAPDVAERGQAAITRVASLASVPMVGGDRAVREPWRLALAHLRRAGVEWLDDLPPVAHVPPQTQSLLAAALDRPTMHVPTTSLGRLFDAVASLLGVRHEITYEAQAAIDLETLAATVAHGDPRGWTGDRAVAGAGGWGPVPAADRSPGDQRRRVLDPTPVLRAVVEGLRRGQDRAALALGFHVWVARAVVDATHEVGSHSGGSHSGGPPGGGAEPVGLTGGVFANVLLLRAATAGLRQAGRTVVRHRLVPCNDGGLSLGQVVLAAAEGGAGCDSV
jgi:hydrogenase maturation protein HypF